MKIKEAFLVVSAIIAFASVIFVVNNAAVHDATRVDRIEKCVIKNKELAQPREYCRAAVNQGVE